MRTITWGSQATLVGWGSGKNIQRGPSHLSGFDGIGQSIFLDTPAGTVDTYTFLVRAKVPHSLALVPWSADRNKIGGRQ